MSGLRPKHDVTREKQNFLRVDDYDPPTTAQSMSIQFQNPEHKRRRGEERRQVIVILNLAIDDSLAHTPRHRILVLCRAARSRGGRLDFANFSIIVLPL
jgi:hypothetical protein